MNLRKKRILAAKVLGVGVNKVMFDEDRLDDVKEAITKSDIRGLISGGAIKAEKKHGISGYRFRKRLLQKRKGRRQGMGSRKGKRTARLSLKLGWMNKIRMQRKYLKFLKNKGIIGKKDFRKVYKKASGGFFRSRRHVKLYLQENGLIKQNEGTRKKEEGRQNRL